MLGTENVPDGDSDAGADETGAGVSETAAEDEAEEAEAEADEMMILEPVGKVLSAESEDEEGKADEDETRTLLDSVGVAEASENILEVEDAWEEDEEEAEEKEEEEEMIACLSEEGKDVMCDGINLEMKRGLSLSQ